MKRILIAGLVASSLCMGSVHAEPVAQRLHLLLLV